MLRVARGIAEANWRQRLMIHREWYIHPDISSHPNPTGVKARWRNVRLGHGKIKYHLENRSTQKSE